MNSQKYADNRVYLVQVAEGHSVNDLVGTGGNSPVSWISSLRHDAGFQTGPWTKELSWNLTESARFQPGPVYFLCTHLVNGEEITFGVAGPVNVEN